MNKLKIKDKVKPHKNLVRWYKNHLEEIFSITNNKRKFFDSHADEMLMWATAALGHDPRGTIICYGAPDELNEKRSLGVVFQNKFGKAFNYFDEQDLVKITTKRKKRK